MNNFAPLVNIRFSTYKNIFEDNVQILLSARVNGEHRVAEIKWVETPEAQPVKPTMILKSDEYNKFEKGIIDELRHRGSLEDSPEVNGMRGRLVAQEAHLSDMRNIVFNKRVTFKDLLGES